MTTTEKTHTIAKCYAHHLAEGLSHEAAVAHITAGLGISPEAVHYAVAPYLEIAALTHKVTA